MLRYGLNTEPDLVQIANSKQKYKTEQSIHNICNMYWPPCGCGFLSCLFSHFVDLLFHSVSVFCILFILFQFWSQILLSTQYEYWVDLQSYSSYFIHHTYAIRIGAVTLFFPFNFFLNSFSFWERSRAFIHSFTHSVFIHVFIEIHYAELQNYCHCSPYDTYNILDILYYILCLCIFTDNLFFLCWYLSGFLTWTHVYTI